jgi:acetoin utilization protein AcuB
MDMTMTVASYMTPFPHHIGPDHSMAAAQRLMRRHQIRHLPVLDDESKLVGVVSQRDLYFLESLTDVAPESILVSEAMQEEVLSLAPDIPMSSAARTMAEARAGSVVVMKEGKVVGIFTTIDALRALTELTEIGDEILASQ